MRALPSLSCMAFPDFPDVSTHSSVFFRIEQFGETRVFLEKREVFVVTRMVTIGGAKLDGDFQIGEGGIGFAGKAVQGGKGVDNVIGLGSLFARLIEAFARFVPAAEIHHGHAALVMVLGGAGSLF